MQIRSTRIDHGRGVDIDDGEFAPTEAVPHTGTRRDAVVAADHHADRRTIEWRILGEAGGVVHLQGTEAPPHGRIDAHVAVLDEDLIAPQGTDLGLADLEVLRSRHTVVGSLSEKHRSRGGCHRWS